MNHQFSSLEYLKNLKKDKLFQREILKPYFQNDVKFVTNVSTKFNQNQNQAFQDWLARVDSVERNRLPREWFPDKGFHFMD